MVSPWGVSRQGVRWWNYLLDAARAGLSGDAYHAMLHEHGISYRHQVEHADIRETKQALGRVNEMRKVSTEEPIWEGLHTYSETDLPKPYMYTVQYGFIDPLTGEEEQGRVEVVSDVRLSIEQAEDLARNQVWESFALEVTEAQLLIAWHER